jgi:hypothetical protein
VYITYRFRRIKESWLKFSGVFSRFAYGIHDYVFLVAQRRKYGNEMKNDFQTSEVGVK